MSKKTMPELDGDSGWYNRTRETMWDDGMIDFYRHVQVKSFRDVDEAAKFVVEHDCPKKCWTIRFKTKGSNIRFFAVAPPEEIK